MDQRLNHHGLAAAALTLMNSLREQLNKRVVAAILVGMLIDILLFSALLALGADANLSQIAGFSSAAVSNFFWTAFETPMDPRQASGLSPWMRAQRFLIVSLLALFLRSAVFLLLVSQWHWQYWTAILVTTLVGALVLFIGTAVFVFSKSIAVDMVDWRIITIVVVTYALLLRLVFLRVVNLIPEEAYYWNYAQHLDFGYLDHPPMVAWLIWFFTSILGKSEFSVRLAAYICWIIGTLFVFRLTLNLFDRTSALRGILLLSVLPIYFGLGFFMTPDAPLYAAWAACLYYLERALLGQERRAWLGVGISMGLGLLAKYTVALLGLGTLVFVLIDRQSRRWLIRPEPYLAAVLAFTIFSPVLFWNMRHEWVSFVFQGPNRLRAKPKFYLHFLIGSFFLLLTPTALFGILKGFLPQNLPTRAEYQDTVDSRRRLWILTFTLIPLSVFAFYSVRHQVKLNWTAPIWLAAIPLLAWDMVPRSGEIVGLLGRWIRRLWMPTIIGLLIIHGAAFYYISLGFPGTGPASSTRIFGPWRLLGNRVEAIEAMIENETQSEPLIVGMDRNFISSELSFYDFVDYDSVGNTGGANLFGDRSLMWAFWLPAAAAQGRNFIMIDFNRKNVATPFLSQFFETTSDVFTDTVEDNGRTVARFYWRVGYGYRGFQKTPTFQPRSAYRKRGSDKRQ